jgi:hypothetical protein
LYELHAYEHPTLDNNPYRVLLGDALPLCVPISTASAL